MCLIRMDDDECYGVSAIKAAKNTAPSRAAHKGLRQGHWGSACAGNRTSRSG
jgi:hypothetical protein